MFTIDSYNEHRYLDEYYHSAYYRNEFSGIPSNLQTCCSGEVRVVTKQIRVVKKRKQVFENVDTFFCKDCNKPLRAVNPNNKKRKK